MFFLKDRRRGFVGSQLLIYRSNTFYVLEINGKCFNLYLNLLIVCILPNKVKSLVYNYCCFSKLPSKSNV